jgi:Tfp pilus assembly protein PilF
MLMQLTRPKISRAVISHPDARKVPGPMPDRANRGSTKSYINISAFLMFLAMLGWFGRDGRRIESLLPNIVVALVGLALLGICLREGRRRASGDLRTACVGSGTERECVAKETKLRRRELVFGAAVVAAIAGASGAYLYMASAPARADAAFQEGMRRMGAGDYKAAVEGFTKAVNIWPRMATGYFERGVARTSMHQADAAIEDFKRAISKDPSMALAHTALGEIYRERGDLTRAMNEFALSLQLNTSTEALYERGQVHESLGQHQQAIEDYDAAIHEQPDAPFVYRARAMSLEALGDHDGAAKDRAAFGHRCLDRDLTASCF